LSIGPTESLVMVNPGSVRFAGAPAGST
jgi:hypothetical protein